MHKQIWIIFAVSILGMSLPQYAYAEEIKVSEIPLCKNNGISILQSIKLNNVIQLSAKEKEYLILLTYVESGNQEEEGQVAVAATILNRLESPEFPDSIEEIAFQKGQFSSTKNHKFYIGDKAVTIEMVPEQTFKAVDRALLGEDPTRDYLKNEAEVKGVDIEKYAGDGALYFYNPKGCSQQALANRANIKISVSIGAHNFYKYWD